ncbi:MAG: autotransporter domain-containing protein [Proteobacteria bacterium]|nr:autotransporter domain-containing protein [Pseudomonadota bacterium]
MRSSLPVHPSIHRSAPRSQTLGNFGIFAKAMVFLLLLLGGGWSTRSHAGAFIGCDVYTNAPTAQSGTVGTSLNYTFQVVDGGNCNVTFGTPTLDNIIITSDTTGGASITAPTSKQYTGFADPSVPFTLQLGPSAGSVTIHVRCQSWCGITSTDITYTATANPVVPPPILLAKQITLINGNPVPGTVTAGDVLTYQVTATNNNPTGGTLSNVQINDPLISPSTITCATVSNPGTCVLTGTYTVTNADMARGLVVNTATATAAGYTGNVPVTLRTGVTTAPAMTLTKTFASYADNDHSGNVSPGDVITYTIATKNTGNVPLTNLTISDPTTTPNSYNCGTLAVGNTCTFSPTYTVTSGDAKATKTLNTATGTSTEITAPVGSNTVNTPVFPSPSMTVQKVLTLVTGGNSAGQPIEGSVLTYQVTATNNGGGVLTNVVVSDPLTTPNSNTCASVAIGASCILTGTYTVTRPDVDRRQIVNTGTATSTQLPTGVSDTLTTAVYTTPKAIVTKVLSRNFDTRYPGLVVLGDRLEFTVTATNTGNVALANLTVSDPLTSPSSITCSSVGIGSTCVLVGSYTVTAADVAAGAITNTGTASAGQLRTPVQTTLVTAVSGTPALSITKALTHNSGGNTVAQGDVLTYTVTATNSGQIALTGVLVNDPLTTPASTTCASVPIGGTCVLNGNYTVTAADASNGSIRNTGTASVPVISRPVQALLVTPVSNKVPAMTVVKALTNVTGGNAAGNAIQGSVLTYTVTATNTGTSVLGNVQVSDPLTSPSSTTCATVGVGGTCVLTGSYTVTATDVSNGSISNTGSASANQFSAPIPSNTVKTPVSPTATMSVTKTLASVAGGSPTHVVPGNVLTYDVTATNTGNVTLATVTVSDPLTTPSTTTCSNVAVNATCVLSGTYTATTADASNGSISNTGSATAGAQITTAVTQTLNTPVFAPNPTIAIVSGNNQTGTPNNALPAPLVVSVLNNGSAAAGVTVNWAVTSGSATLGSATSVTAANGQATNTVTLGANPGAVTITATRADYTTQSVTFSETNGSPVLTIVSGNNQVGVTGTAALHPMVVNLTNGAGAPFANQTVTWQVTSGSATVNSGTSTTDANGNAQMGFSYGATPGAIAISATVAGSSVSFSETALGYVITITGGNNQTAAPGQALPQPFQVNVSIPGGVTITARQKQPHPMFAGGVSGVAVQWTVLSGGGSLASGASTVTDGSGNSSNQYTMGTGTGPNTVQVSVIGGNSVTFTATPMTAATMTIVSGNNQHLAPGTASQPLVVQVMSGSSPVVGLTVNWSASNATLASATSVTDSNGRATNTAQVSVVGAATVTASTTNPTSGPATFGLNGGLSLISGLTPLQGQITGALDNACTALAAMTNLTPAQQDLLNQCNALAGAAGSNPSQVLGAIDQMFSDSAYLETSAAMLISTAQFDNIKARIAALRSGTGGDHFGGLAFSTPNGSLPIGSLAASSLNASDSDKDKQEAGAGFDRWGFFLSGTFSHGSADPRQSLPGYGFNTNGVTGGVDYRFNDHFIAGISAGFAKYRAGINANGAGGMDTTGWSLSAYSTFFQKDNWYVDGVFTWGNNSYNLSRTIVYTLTGPGGTTTVNQSATGKDSGTTLAAAITLGRDFNKGPWSFGPYFRGTWTRVNFDGYQETLQPGSGSGLGLAVQTHALTSTASVLGAKVNYASSQNWGVWMPHAEVEWQHEFQTSPDAITARFLADPTQTPITANGFPIDSDFFRLGLGMSFVFPQGRSGFVYYEKILGRTGITQDNIAVGLRIEF